MTRRCLVSALSALAVPAVTAGTLTREPLAYITITVSCSNEVQAQDVMDILATKLRDAVMPTPQSTSYGSEVVTTRGVEYVTRTHQKVLSVQGEVRLSQDR